MGTKEKVTPFVVAAVRERGYTGVTFEGIASASGVAKTTLYRHWPSRAEMVFELVVHDRDLVGLDCEPTIEGASRALAERVVDFMTGGIPGHVMAALIVDIAADPELAERFRQGFATRGRAEVQGVLDRSGLAPADGLDAGDLQMVLLGAAQAWLTVAGLAPQVAVDRLAHLASALLKEAS